MRLQHQLAPHSLICNLYLSRRKRLPGFSSYCSPLPTFSLRGRRTPLSILLSTLHGESINHVIPYCAFFQKFWGKKGFCIWRRKILMHYSKESNEILQELCFTVLKLCFTVLAINTPCHSREMYSPSSSVAQDWAPRSPKARIICTWNKCKENCN